MQLIRTSIVGSAAIVMAACSAGEGDGRSAAKLSVIDYTVQGSGSTTIGQIEIGYDGAQVKDVAFRTNGASGGRMEFRYAGSRVNGIDVTDAEGDEGSYAWNYDDDRLASIVWSVPQVVSREQEFEYDDTEGGRARRVTYTTTWNGAQPSSTVQSYDYDDRGRLEEIVTAGSELSTEIRYDEESRIERITEYQSGDFVDSELSYDDQGRLSRIESSEGARHEISYDDEGRIEEVLVLSGGQTVTATYSYVPGEVAGLTFTPSLPVAGLVDLRGQPFDRPDFTAVGAQFAIGDVPAPEPIETCDHHVCDVGVALSASCDSCAATVCAQDSYCCTSSWDSTCVAAAESLCGASCGGSTTCSHDVCTVGAALASSCGSCEATICAYDSYCCSSSWDATCVGYVASQCGYTCGP